METNTTTAAVAQQTDATLWDMLMTYNGRRCQDRNGNLRGLDENETAFGKALRAECKRRGLI